MAAWTTDPYTYDATCIVGDTLSLGFTLEDDVNVPNDLTGVTGVASVKSEPGGTVIATPTVTITSAADGQFDVVLDAADTADLVPGSYRWAARLTWTDGTVKTVVEGRLVVRLSAVD